MRTQALLISGLLIVMFTSGTVIANAEDEATMNSDNFCMPADRLLGSESMAPFTQVEHIEEFITGSQNITIPANEVWLFTGSTTLQATQSIIIDGWLLLSNPMDGEPANLELVAPEIVISGLIATSSAQKTGADDLILNLLDQSIHRAASPTGGSISLTTDLLELVEGFCIATGDGAKATSIRAPAYSQPCIPAELEQPDQIASREFVQSLSAGNGGSGGDIIVSALNEASALPIVSSASSQLGGIYLGNGGHGGEVWAEYRPLDHIAKVVGTGGKGGDSGQVLATGATESSSELERSLLQYLASESGNGGHGGDASINLSSTTMECIRNLLTSVLDELEQLQPSTNLIETLVAVLEEFLAGINVPDIPDPEIPPLPIGTLIETAIRVINEFLDSIQLPDPELPDPELPDPELPRPSITEVIQTLINAVEDSGIPELDGEDGLGSNGVPVYTACARHGTPNPPIDGQDGQDGQTSPNGMIGYGGTPGSRGFNGLENGHEGGTASAIGGPGGFGVRHGGDGGFASAGGQCGGKGADGGSGGEGGRGAKGTFRSGCHAAGGDGGMATTGGFGGEAEANGGAGGDAILGLAGRGGDSTPTGGDGGDGGSGGDAGSGAVAGIAGQGMWGRAGGFAFGAAGPGGWSVVNGVADNGDYTPTNGLPGTEGEQGDPGENWGLGPCVGDDGELPDSSELVGEVSEIVDEKVAEAEELINGLVGFIGSLQ